MRRFRCMPGGVRKGELIRRRGMTSLLDIFKEADLRIGFTQAFTTAASREAVDRREVQRRLLLCLYALGTNAGLKRLSVGNHDISVSGVTLHPALLSQRREPARRDPARRQRDVRRAAHEHLGRGDVGVRVGQQEIRRVGSEPHDRMAYPLRRARRDDLLARRAEIGVHLLATQTLFIVGGRLDDRGRPPPRHGDVPRSAIRG